jgi:hypothetical protein
MGRPQERELLRRAAAAGFTVFVTADRNLEFQQNVAASSLAVIIVISRRIRFRDLLPLVPELQQAIGEVRPGEVRRVGTP